MTTSDRYDSVGDNFGTRQPDRRTVLAEARARHPHRVAHVLRAASERGEDLVVVLAAA